MRTTQDYFLKHATILCQVDSRGRSRRKGNTQTRQTQTMYCGDKFEEEKKLRKRGFIYSSLKTGIAQKFETI